LQLKPIDMKSKLQNGAPAGQGSQLPQCWGLPAVTQPPPQQIWYAGHALPHMPQLNGSIIKSVQIAAVPGPPLVQTLLGAGQANEQLPATQ
jgi:hypothetical protein